MSEKRKIRIGLLGFGVVGQGVWKNIERNREALEYRLGAELEITDIMVKDLARKREVEVAASLLTTDASRVVRGLKNLDFLVVIDMFMTRTARLHPASRIPHPASQ